MPAFPNQSLIAQMAPVAPYTRSVTFTLSRTSQEAGRYRIPFQWPVVIQATKISVIAGSAAGGLVAPTLDALVMALSVSEEKSFTSSARDDGASDLGELYADAVALDVAQAPRNLQIVLATPGELGIYVRWKRWTGSAIYEDAIVTVSALYRRCSPQEAREAIDAMKEWSR